MSLSSQNLLDIAEAIAGLADNASTIDWVLPSPFRFSSKSDFFAALDDAKDTKTEIETALVRSAWIRYLSFEDEAGEDGIERDIEDPVRNLIYEITVFHESTFERLDQTVTPDAFNKQVRKTNHEHVTAVMALCGEFQGVNPIADLLADFTVAETVSLAQTDASEYNVECDYIPGVIGDQTKLECRVRIQIPC